MEDTLVAERLEVDIDVQEEISVPQTALERLAKQSQGLIALAEMGRDPSAPYEGTSAQIEGRRIDLLEPFIDALRLGPIALPGGEDPQTRPVLQRFRVLRRQALPEPPRLLPPAGKIQQASRLGVVEAGAIPSRRS